MAHPLEVQYDLTATELLDAIDRRFRLKVALEGAVAEVHFERKLKVATQEGWLAAYEAHDLDNLHDYTVTTNAGTILRVEVKTVRNETKAKVELRKTRASRADPSNRFYDREQFDLVAVCMGRRTGVWSEFRYVLVSAMAAHHQFPGKIEVMHPVLEPSPGGPWFGRLQDVIDALA